MAAGLEWFPLETNLLTDDEKVFDLMDDATDDDAFADFGRLIALLSRIYRTVPALQVDRRMERRIAHDLGLDLAGFADFVKRCADADLIDLTLWEEEHVITSRGIQLRWIKAKGRSKSSGIPVEMRQWSLVDKSSATNSEAKNGKETRSEVFKDSEKAETTQGENSAIFKSSENSPLEEKRGEETREEEKREEPVGNLSGEGQVFDKSPNNSNEDVEKSEGCGGCEYRPACLARPGGSSEVFMDGEDAPHRTRYGALEARYAQQTHRRDFDRLMAKVSDMCPASCRASPDDVDECYTLLSRAIDASDPKRGNPWPLVRHILANDRGNRDA